jgi:hypothetical protein
VAQFESTGMVIGSRPKETESMKKPHLEITQNDKSGLHGKCSSCDEYLTIGGPGMARNPAAAMRTLQRQFDKHFRQNHMREAPPKPLLGS